MPFDAIPAPPPDELDPIAGGRSPNGGAVTAADPPTPPAPAATPAPPTDVARAANVEPDVLRKMYVLRRILNPRGTVDAIEFLLDKIRQTKTNGDFVESMNT